MGDPFSIGAGIVGVISLTIQITQVVVKFGLDWKDAPKDVKMFMTELQGLKTVLSETHTNIIVNPDFAEAFQNRPSTLLSQLGPSANALGNSKDALAACSKQLENLLNELEKRATASRFGWKRLKAPFLAQNTQISVDRLRNHCQIFNNLISIDTAVLGAITLREVKEARGEQQEWHEVEEKQKILDWLSLLSFHRKQNDTLSGRHPGTGQWFLELVPFRNWCDGDITSPSTLWCPGIPGSGKSVMTSIVVDHLKTAIAMEQVAFAFIYCDYKDSRSQTAANLIPSLVRQLVEQHEAVPNEVSKAFADHKRGDEPLSTKKCTELLLSLPTYFRRTFILIDALDECSGTNEEGKSNQQDFLNVLLRLRQTGDGYRDCRLFMTSRENRRVEEQLTDYTRIEIRATDSDVESYIRSTIADDTKFNFSEAVNRNPHLGQAIISKLVQNARGMFLLPRLHLGRLGCQTSVRNLRKALDNLPTQLNELYDNAIARIESQPEEYYKLAIQVLLWIIHALRPLRIEELQHALAIESGDRDLDEEGLQSEKLLISVCAGLVSVDNESRAIRLVHFTVEEYFKKTNQKWFPDAALRITETCLTYLLFDAFATGDCRSDSELSERLDDYPFLVYAAQNWGFHARGDPERQTKYLAVEFLENDLKLLSSAQARDRSPLQPDGFISVDFPRGTTGLQVAASFGLYEMVGLLLKRGADVAARDVNGWTALHWAAAGGYDTVAELLLKRGADVDAATYSGETAIMWAAWKIHESIVRILLDNGANVTLKDFHGTALHRAAHVGHEGMVRLLLERGVDVKATTEDGRTALHRAAEGGSVAVVKLLLGADIDINSRCRNKTTPLMWAAHMGHLPVVQFLLQNGADIAAKDYWGTALHRAAHIGHETMTRLLLDGGADTTATTEDGRTVLHRAAESGNVAVMKLLLEAGLEINARCNSKTTPLMWAAHMEHLPMVQFLLQNGAEPTAKDAHGTALHRAAQTGNEAMVRLLLEKGADATVKAEDGRTALDLAVGSGNEVISLILKKVMAADGMHKGDSFSGEDKS